MCVSVKHMYLKFFYLVVHSFRPKRVRLGFILRTSFFFFAFFKKRSGGTCSCLLLYKKKGYIFFLRDPDLGLTVPISNPCFVCCSSGREGVAIEQMQTRLVWLKGGAIFCYFGVVSHTRDVIYFSFFLGGGLFWKGF